MYKTWIYSPHAAGANKVLFLKELKFKKADFRSIKRSLRAEHLDRGQLLMSFAADQTDTTEPGASQSIRTSHGASQSIRTSPGASQGSALQVLGVKEDPRWWYFSPLLPSSG